MEILSSICSLCEVIWEIGEIAPKDATGSGIHKSVKFDGVSKENTESDAGKPEW